MFAKLSKNAGIPIIDAELEIQGKLILVHVP